MATSVPFGRRVSAPQPKSVVPQGSGDGMIPPELDTDPRKNINPKTQPKQAQLNKQRPKVAAKMGYT